MSEMSFWPRIHKARLWSLLEQWLLLLLLLQGALQLSCPGQLTLV